MRPWESLSRDHHEILTKIQLLKEASIDLLRERTTDHMLAKALKLQKDYLELFKVRVTKLFMMEEEALFPVLLKGEGNRAKTLVSELLDEHKTMMKKYFRIRKIKGSDQVESKLLLEMLNDLSAHAQKEESLIPPLLKRLNQEQLNEVNEIARHLGYNFKTPTK